MTTENKIFSVLLIITGTLWSYISIIFKNKKSYISHKTVGIKIFLNYFCVMIERSGGSQNHTVPHTNRPGSGSRRPKKTSWSGSATLGLIVLFPGIRAGNLCYLNRHRDTFYRQAQFIGCFPVVAKHRCESGTAIFSMKFPEFFKFFHERLSATAMDRTGFGSSVPSTFYSCLFADVLIAINKLSFSDSWTKEGSGEILQRNRRRCLTSISTPTWPIPIPARRQR